MIPILHSSGCNKEQHAHLGILFVRVFFCVFAGLGVYVCVGVWVYVLRCMGLRLVRGSM